MQRPSFQQSPWAPTSGGIHASQSLGPPGPQPLSMPPGRPNMASQQHQALQHPLANTQAPLGEAHGGFARPPGSLAAPLQPQHSAAPSGQPPSGQLSRINLSNGPSGPPPWQPGLQRPPLLVGRPPGMGLPHANGPRSLPAHQQQLLRPPPPQPGFQRPQLGAPPLDGAPKYRGLPGAAAPMPGPPPPLANGHAPHMRPPPPPGMAPMGGPPQWAGGPPRAAGGGPPMGPPLRPPGFGPPGTAARPMSPPPTSIGVAGTPPRDMQGMAGPQAQQQGLSAWQARPAPHTSIIPGRPPPMMGQTPLGGGEFVQPPQGNKIDQSQMPRRSHGSLQEPPELFETRYNGEHAIPPLAGAKFVVQDRGDCNPRCMRATLNYIPATPDLAKIAAMPFGVLICPLALPYPADDPIQVVDFGEAGPVRCAECKAYMNPFMQFIEAGRKFICAFCGAITPTPPDYVENVGPDGRRRDADHRPELCRGSVEFVATQQFMARPPMLPTHVFLIDVSYTAMATGATASACASIASILDCLQGGERVHIAIVTFDTTVHFFSMRSEQSAPQMLVMPDTQQPYCPAATSSLIVPLHESRHLVEGLLEQIPTLFSKQQSVDACLGGAVEACIQLLKSHTGGKLHVFASILPKVGKGALTVREDARMAAEKDPQKAQEPARPAFRDMAADAAEFQVSVDLYVMAQGYVDLATLRTLCQATAGQAHLYAPWSPAHDADQLQNDLRWSAIRPQGLEAVGRLRASAGLEVEHYAGAFFRRNPSDIEFPALSSDHCFGAALRVEAPLPMSRPALLQFALLYSTPLGERRIRVHTMALPVKDALGQVFRGIDVEAQLCILAMNLAAKVPGGTLAATKEATTKATVEMLNTYRKNCSGQSAASQLVLPDAGKLGPLYHLALLKCPAFRVETRADERTLWLQRLLTSTVAALVDLVHGRLLPFTDLLSAAAAGEELPQGSELVPEPCFGLTAAKLKDDGVFLWENGADAILWFGPQISPVLLQAIMGNESLELRGNAEAARRPLGLPRLDTAPSRALHAALDAVRAERGAYMSLRVARRGDLLEAAFQANLVEDKSSAGPSYVDFLCTVHRHIQERNR